LIRSDDVEVEAVVEVRLKTELPNFMQPRTIIRLVDFPRTPNGKIDRVALAKEYDR
jgi:acyl-coenzyme A synthetase/AMP-(fatty) acid ligase